MTRPLIQNFLLMLSIFLSLPAFTEPTFMPSPQAEGCATEKYLVRVQDTEQVPMGMRSNLNKKGITWVACELAKEQQEKMSCPKEGDWRISKKLGVWYCQHPIFPTTSLKESEVNIPSPEKACPAPFQYFRFQGMDKPLVGYSCRLPVLVPLAALHEKSLDKNQLCAPGWKYVTEVTLMDSRLPAILCMKSKPKKK